MVGTAGDVLLVQCELNALSHLFCELSFASTVPVGGRFAISVDSKNISSSFFFFSFEDQEQLSQCSIMHSTDCDFIW